MTCPEVGPARRLGHRETPAAVTVPLPNAVEPVTPMTSPIEADPVAPARANGTRSHTPDTAAAGLHVDFVQEIEPSLSIFAVQQRWPRAPQSSW
jgi:hypothetical protein